MALSLQDLCIRKTAVQCNVPENIVDLVIAHKNKSMYEALALHNSVEDSGLCKLSVRLSRVSKRLAKMAFTELWLGEKLKEELTDKERAKQTKILNNLLQDKAYLETKLRQDGI